MVDLWLNVLPWLGFREPFSALTHLLGAVLSLGALAALLRRAHARGRRGWALVDLGLYGAAMAFAFVASTLFHTFMRAPDGLVLYKKLDHAAIFVMMAGTGTAIYSALPTRRRRKAVLIAALWAVSLAALVVKMRVWPMPLWLTALIYVTVGWASAGGFFFVVREWGWRRLGLFFAGAAVLTLGAVIFALEWPVLWPGLIEGHELFHVLVLLGIGLHAMFVYRHCTIPGAFAAYDDEPAVDLDLAPSPIPTNA